MGEKRPEIEKLKKKEITITETRKKLKRRKNCKAYVLPHSSSDRKQCYGHKYGYALALYLCLYPAVFVFCLMTNSVFNCLHSKSATTSRGDSTLQVKTQSSATAQ